MGRGRELVEVRLDDGVEFDRQRLWLEGGRRRCGRVAVGVCCQLANKILHNFHHKQRAAFARLIDLIQCRGLDGLCANRCHQSRRLPGSKGPQLHFCQQPGNSQVHQEGAQRMLIRQLFRLAAPMSSTWAWRALRTK